MLSYMVRDRPKGERLDLEWAVMQQTQRMARIIGLYDRGTLEPGMKADINIIDFDCAVIKDVCDSCLSSAIMAI